MSNLKTILIAANAGSNAVSDPKLAYAILIGVHRSGVQFHPVYNGMSSGLDVGFNASSGMLIFNEKFNANETVFVIYREGDGEVTEPESPPPPDPEVCPVPSGLILSQSGGTLYVNFPVNGNYFISVSPAASACGEDVIVSGSTGFGGLWSTPIADGNYLVCAYALCGSTPSETISSTIEVTSAPPPPPTEESAVINNAPSGSVNLISPIFFLPDYPVNPGQTALFTHTGFTQSFTVNISKGGTAPRYIKLLLDGATFACQEAVNGDNILPSMYAPPYSSVQFILTNIPC